MGEQTRFTSEMIKPQLVEWQLFESNNCRFREFDVRHLFDKIKTVFLVFADKSQQKIKDWHLFEDYKPSSDRAGFELGKSQNEVLSILFGYNL